MDMASHTLTLPAAWKIGSAVNFLGDKVKTSESDGPTVWPITTEPLYLTIAGEVPDNWAVDFVR
jgi:hypothetical protein